jgi:hypothetical protein
MIASDLPTADDDHRDMGDRSARCSWAIVVMSACDHHDNASDDHDGGE